MIWVTESLLGPLEAKMETYRHSTGSQFNVIYLLSTHNIIANIRDARLYECAVRAMRKKLKLSSDSGSSDSNKCKRGNGGACGGVWRSLRLARVGVWSLESGVRSQESGCRLCVWQESGFSRCE
jgi:hypothetical protein